jgi:hypothetical protein
MLWISSPPGFFTLLKIPILYPSILHAKRGFLLVTHHILFIISLSLKQMECCYTTFIIPIPVPLSTNPDLGSRRKGLLGVSNMTEHIAVWSPDLLGWGKSMIQKGKGFVFQFPMYPCHWDLYQCFQTSPIACATWLVKLTVFLVLDLENQSGITEDQTSDS